MFAFEQSPLTLSADLTSMALAAWNCDQLDWSRVVEEGLKRLIWEKSGTLLENHEFQVYLSLLCTVAL